MGGLFGRGTKLLAVSVAFEYPYCIATAPEADLAEQQRQHQKLGLFPLHLKTSKGCPGQVTSKAEMPDGRSVWQRCKVSSRLCDHTARLDLILQPVMLLLQLAHLQVVTQLASFPVH